MKAARLFLALLICFCIMLPQSFADLWERAESDVYKEKVGPMFVRGLLNAGTSPVDILVQTVDKTKSGPPLIGTLTGMAGGLGCTALRAASGIVDVALFWVPGFNGFPVNRSYHNCLLCDGSENEMVPVQQQIVQTPVYVTSEPQKPLVTVSEEPAAVTPVATTSAVATPKKKVHDPYRYVKK